MPVVSIASLPEGHFFWYPKEEIEFSTCSTQLESATEELKKEKTCSVLALDRKFLDGSFNPEESERSTDIETGVVWLLFMQNNPNITNIFYVIDGDKHYKEDGFMTCWTIVDGAVDRLRQAIHEAKTTWFQWEGAKEVDIQVVKLIVAENSLEAVSKTLEKGVEN